MKPYGQKPKKMTGKVKCHTSDMCDTCSNDQWKVSKRRARSQWRKEINE